MKNFAKFALKSEDAANIGATDLCKKSCTTDIKGRRKNCAISRSKTEQFKKARKRTSDLVWNIISTPFPQVSSVQINLDEIFAVIPEENFEAAKNLVENQTPGPRKAFRIKR